MIESERIAREKIKLLNLYDPEVFDALILPGGFGVAKNLCSFAFEGSDCMVDPEVEISIILSVEAGIPIGGLCIAPALLAKILPGAMVTIGSKKGMVKALEKMGAKHNITNYWEAVVDNKYKLVTSPCYMLDANIVQIAEEIENVVTEMIGLM